MRFAEPTWLYLLAVAPLLAGLYLYEAAARRRALERIGDAKLVTRLMAGLSPEKRAWKIALTLLGVTLLVLALGRPQFGSTTSISHKRGLDIVVALDFSKSMLTRDTKPDRLGRAKVEISRLLSTLDGDRVGLVAFAGETDVYPLTTDYDALRLFWRDLTPYDMPIGGTAIGRAISSSITLLTGDDDDWAPADAEPPVTEEPKEAAEEPDKVIVLITDGEDTISEPLAAADAAATLGIRIYTVGIGSASGGPIPLYEGRELIGYVTEKEEGTAKAKTSHLDEATLQAIADKTGGKYFRSELATTGMEEMAEEIGTLRKVDIEQRLTRRYQERYHFFLFPAFCLLLIEAVLADRRRRDRRRLVPVEGDART